MVDSNVLIDKKPQLYGDERNMCDWIYVDDSSSAVGAILTRGQSVESYLIGTGCARSNLDVVRLILQEVS